MSHASRVTSRSRRLTAAITAALAVTAGTLATAPAALAATTAVSAPAAAGEVTPFPLASEIVSAGATGFLSRNTSGEYRWTRNEGGASTVVASQAAVLGAASDVLVSTVGDRVLRVQDMTGGAAPVDIDLKTLTDGTHTAFGAVGSTVLTSVKTPAGATELHLVSASVSGMITNRTVYGLPAGAGSFTVRAAISGTAMVGFQAAGKTLFAVVDLAAPEVVAKTYENRNPAADSPFAALSATHVAWTEYTKDASNQDIGVVVVTDRKTGATRSFPVGAHKHVELGLTGSWLVHETMRNGETAFDAKSLNDEPAKQLLAHATSLATAPDGALLVRGGSLTEGAGEEGLYRVAPGVEGAITRQLVAATGEPTQLVVTPRIPQVIDLDKNRGVFPFTFDVSRGRVYADIALSYGDQDCEFAWGNYDWWAQASAKDAPSGPGSISLTWEGSRHDRNGEFNSYGQAANGTWTWCATVSPLDHVGPGWSQRGTFTVTHKPHPHDFSDNGSPDPIVVGPTGGMGSYDGDYSPSIDFVSWDDVRPVWGTGWNVYDRFTVPGDLGGTADPEIVARDKSGGLWLYSRAWPNLSPRIKIGSGWQVYDKINGTADMTGDGKPDVLAVDKSGGFWLYPGTGNVNAPLGARKQIGAGWGIYNQIIAPGNLGGAPAADLLARDAAGVLWMYPGKGNGTYGPRVRVGGGWNGYTRLFSFGDATRDGRPDLFVSFPDASTYSGTGGYLYEGTGDANAPFKLRKKAYVPVDKTTVAVF
ncbi:VCBS repeat-containing protein [Streptomyces sp. R44]|uniref:VCBS repeat-containing protein n=1 Tax=Streptomyces sp. R44 TaxID=3238633 RepID=A0AB39SZV4_9ACTN